MPFTLNRILLGCAMTLAPPLLLFWIDHTFHVNWELIRATGWVYLFLFVLYLIFKAIQTRREIHAENLAERQKVREFAVVQATYLWKFQEEALELIFKLESVWHHWHNAGDVLLRPLDINLPKILDSTMNAIQGELREFKRNYGEHLFKVQRDFPSIQSATLTGSYPSDREYVIVLYDLREHAAILGSTAQRLFDSGIPIA